MKEIQKIKEVLEIKICPYSMISYANFKKGDWLSDIAIYTDAIASKKQMREAITISVNDNHNF